MKKIAILTERLKTGFGVDLAVHEQATRLTKYFKVVVFAVEIEKSFIKKAPYNVFSVNIPLFFNPIKQDLSSFKNFKQYRHILKKYDAFIIHTPTYNAWIPFLAKIGKVIVYYYGNSPSYGYLGLKKYRKQIFDCLENNFYFKYANKIITISSYLKRELSDSIRSKTEVELLGCEHVTKYNLQLQSRNLAVIRSKYFIENNDLLLTYIGRLDYNNNPYKNTYDLIKLQRLLVKQNNKKRIKIFTIGLPENNIEKKFFNEGICVVPNASITDLVAILKSSYLYISPSRWEGFNLPLLEAQSIGVPAIAYNLCAHPEVINNNKTGFLVNTFNEFYNKINYLITNPRKREILSKNAINHATKYSWESSVNKIINSINI